MCHKLAAAVDQMYCFHLPCSLGGSDPYFFLANFRCTCNQIKTSSGGNDHHHQRRRRRARLPSPKHSSAVGRRIPTGSTVQVRTAPPCSCGRTFTTVANLAKLLPTGTVLAFQTLNPTFSNRGTCIAVHWYLTAALITCCALSCAFFSFTDTLLGLGGDVYVGVATFRGFYLFNGQPCGEEEERQLPAADQLWELRIRWVDYVHALFSMLVFLALALSDPHVQSCLFDSAGRDSTQYYLRGPPLAAGFLASFVFLVFPTCRRGIGYSVDMEPRPLRAASRDAGSPASAGVNAIATYAVVQFPGKWLVDVGRVRAMSPSGALELGGRSSTTSEDDPTHVAALISQRR